MYHSFHHKLSATYDEGTQDAVPITIRVNKLSYSITNKPGKWWQKITSVQMPWEWMEKGKTAQILNEVSFTVNSGQVLAIMGGSGSGKTSLLDVLSCRNSTGTVTGDVYLNSVVRTKSILDSCAGYVRQEDRLISFLTVRETLTFVARLKMPRKSSSDAVNHRVNRVLEDLGLKHVADTKVGDESIRGISGGERRRVSIGIQLLILPSVLFLDEPTTGLDSFTAHNLVQTLARLASKKRTIVMSIHQPRSDILTIVDRIMLLSKGRIVYNGPGADMVTYFTTLGFPCPELVNPCDFYIDLATVDGTDQEQEEITSKTVQNLHAAYQMQSEAIELLDKDLVVTEELFKQSVESGLYYYPTAMTGRDDRETLQNMLDAYAQTRSTPGLLYQLWMLLFRFMRVTIDNYGLLIVNLIQALMMSVLLGTAYFGLLLNQLSIRDWFGLMFNLSAMYPYMVILGLIGICHEERKFLYYELQDKLYHPAAYYGARILNDVPFHLVNNIFYVLPVYAMAGLKWDFYTFFIFYVFVALSVFTSRCLAMAVAVLLPSFQIGCMTAQVIFTLYIMPAGFFLNIDNLFPETKWLSDASYLRWGFEALSIIQVKDLKFECDAGQTQCITEGEQAMVLYGIDGGELWVCATAQFGTIGVLLLFMFFGLLFIPQKPTNA